MAQNTADIIITLAMLSFLASRRGIAAAACFAAVAILFVPQADIFALAGRILSFMCHSIGTRCKF